MLIIFIIINFKRILRIREEEKRRRIDKNERKTRAYLKEKQIWRHSEVYVWTSSQLD